MTTDTLGFLNMPKVMQEQGSLYTEATLVYIKGHIPVLPKKKTAFVLTSQTGILKYFITKIVSYN